MNTEWDVSDSFRKVEPFVTGKHCRFLGRNRIFEDIPRMPNVQDPTRVCNMNAASSVDRVEQDGPHQAQ